MPLFTSWDKPWLSASAPSRGDQLCQEVLGEALHAVPLGVDVVACGVGTEVAGLVPGDLLHHVTLDEPVPGVEQRTAEQCDAGRAPAGLLLELLDVTLGFLGVAVGGQTHREEIG